MFFFLSFTKIPNEMLLFVFANLFRVMIMAEAQSTIFTWSNAQFLGFCSLLYVWDGFIDNLLKLEKSNNNHKN